MRLLRAEAYAEDLEQIARAIAKDKPGACPRHVGGDRDPG